ncbi:MAG: hypothetical protein ACFFDF_22530 [Candidatus Odinarchaeota archaeon]
MFSTILYSITQDVLTPIEEARAYAINMDFDFSTFPSLEKSFEQGRSKNGKVKRFTEEIGKSTSTIYSRLYLLFLPEEIQRENLTPIETGRTYKNLMEKLPSTQIKNSQELT